jgi:hypothetical protein
VGTEIKNLCLRKYEVILALILKTLNKKGGGKRYIDWHYLTCWGSGAHSFG